MEFCAGGDLANYIKKRGRVEGLEYIPSPGAAPTYYPHPKSGGLDEIVVRSFLRQLGMAHPVSAFDIAKILSSSRYQVPQAARPHPS